MHSQSISFEDLDKWLMRTPVIAELHPLTPLALSQDIRIVDDGEAFTKELDNRNSTPSGGTVILDNHPLLRERFPLFRVTEHPPINAINQCMHRRIDYARQYLITTRTIGQFVERETLRIQADAIVLFLVDGLSYGDVLTWNPDRLEPCFVDGPSVTYRYSERESGSIVDCVGFPGVIGRPSVFQRIRALGYHNARGYTYWAPETNNVAEYMFRGIPYFRSPNFESVLNKLEVEPIQPRTYLQLVRQGLDGLAHGRRELQENEISATLDAIKHDIDRLMNALRRQVASVAIFVTSDHGIAWKNDHSWVQINDVSPRHARFCTQSPPDYYQDSVLRSECGDNIYYLLKMPLLAGGIPYNDSGVHGGISYHESIVPMMLFRR